MKESERLEKAVRASDNFLKVFDKITGKDDLRPILSGVFFDKGYAVATDSHKLVKVSLELYGLEDCNLLDGYFMPNEVLSELKVKKNQMIFIEKGSVVFIGTSGRIIKTLPLVLMEEVGKYPNYEAVIPKERMPVDRFGINGKFLTDIQNIYTMSGYGDGNTLSINTHGENKAMTLTDKEGLFTGLLMPIMIN